VYPLTGAALAAAGVSTDTTPIPEIINISVATPASARVDSEF